MLVMRIGTPAGTHGEIISVLDTMDTFIQNRMMILLRYRCIDIDIQIFAECHEICCIQYQELLSIAQSAIVIIPNRFVQFFSISNILTLTRRNLPSNLRQNTCSTGTYVCLSVFFFFSLYLSQISFSIKWLSIHNHQQTRLNRRHCVRKSTCSQNSGNNQCP